MITSIKKWKLYNESILVPRNLEGRKDKLKQERIKMLSCKFIEGNLEIDETFLEIPEDLVKVKEIHGDVILAIGIGSIPSWLKNVKVFGNFDCTTCGLNNLEGCPYYIAGNFDCSYNYLISLENCPKFIGGKLYCYDNKKLLHLPIGVNLIGKFYNSYNRKNFNYEYIEESVLVPRNLEGRKEKLRQMNIQLLSQEVIEGNLTIDETFENIPLELIKVKEINGNVSSMIKKGYIPSWLKNVKVYKSFNCSHNNLTSLENCPQYVGGYFICNHNQLTSLEGCPKYIGGDFYCNNNAEKLKLPEGVKLKGKFVK